MEIRETKVYKEKEILRNQRLFLSKKKGVSMQRRYRKGQNPWYLIIGLIVISSIIFTIFSQKKQETLPVYTQSDKVKKEEPKEEKELEFDTSIYTDEKYHLSMEIPIDWQPITKDGFRTFVHSPSGSSIQIQTLDYDPTVNMKTAESLSTEIAESGKTFVNYERLSNSSYELQYQDFQKSTYDYIEKVFWDQTSIIKLVCTFNDENYSKIMPYYEKIFDTFSWQRSKEIPEGFVMYYEENTKFQVLFPESWSIGLATNVISVTDEQSGAVESVSIMEASKKLSTITATELTPLLKQNKSNFILKEFDNQNDKIIANCTYVSNDVQYQEDIFIFSANGLYYFLMFDYEDGTIEETLPQQCSESFKTFSK